MALSCAPITNRLDALSMLDDVASVMQLLIELSAGYEADGLGLSTGAVRGLTVVLMTCRKSLHAATEFLDGKLPGADPSDVAF